MTKDFQPLGEMESRFAEIIWQNAPLPSGELVNTMLRRLCTKGLFVNQDGQVQALLSQADFLARQSEDFLAQNFAGSLPRFLTAFCIRQKLSDSDVQELEQLIAQSRGDFDDKPTD